MLSVGTSVQILSSFYLKKEMALEMGVKMMKGRKPSI